MKTALRLLSVFAVISSLLMIILYSCSESEPVEIVVDPCAGITSFIDPRDGHEYSTIKIGDQCWMKENLAWLPSIFSENGSFDSPRYYVYGYEGTNLPDALGTYNYNTYGVLYNWTAANFACPEGWHLPSYLEWDELIRFLGQGAGCKMKTIAHTHWKNPNACATNSSGFSGLPGGEYYINYNLGTFQELNQTANWWSSTEVKGWNSAAYYIGLSYAHGGLNRNGHYKSIGYSVRCLKE